MKELRLVPYEEYVAQLNLKRVAAGVLFRDPDERVLLVDTTKYKKRWDIPGGTTNANEPPWITAEREVVEEIGVRQPQRRLLVIDHIPAVEGDPMPEGLAFVFDGGVLSHDEANAIRHTSPEIRSVGFFTLQEARQLVGDGLWLRITAAVAAAASGNLMLCEAGQPIGTPGPGESSPDGGDHASPA